MEECAPRAEKSHPKILSRIKKLIKELHHEGVLNRKTHWSSEEDELLQKLVEQEKLDWKMIPHHFSSRSQNMCYSRYRRIKLNSKEKKWTQEEEQVLVKLVAEHGEKWKRISQELTSKPVWTQSTRRSKSESATSTTCAPTSTSPTSQSTKI